MAIQENGKIVLVGTQKNCATGDCNSMYIVTLGNETSTAQENISTINNTSLGDNYPNPFTSETTIAYTLDTSQSVVLRVFDVLGREIIVLDEGWRSAGTHRVVFDAGAWTSGIYLYRLEVNDQTYTGRMSKIN